MTTYVASIDQGTTSTRCLVVDDTGHVVAFDRREHDQILPGPGLVEHDPRRLWDDTRAVIAGALERAGLRPADLAAAGVTNQRETTVVWDRRTGEPVHPALVWQDTRTRAICDRLAGRGGGHDRYRQITGLPLATYFSGPKLRWILDEVPGAATAARRGTLAFGTVDSWLMWNLTGGVDGGVHLTDVTNASRTLMMDLSTLDWSPEILQDLDIPTTLLPTIRSSSERYGVGAEDGPLPGVPLTAALGDQQAATFGQTCFSPGEAKNTYGTGNFLLLNTGRDPVRSENGLLTTVAYQLGRSPAVYALEGSIAVTGSLVQWFRDNLGLVDDAAQIESLAASVPDNGGAYLVPAFSGLFAPYWRPDARGALVGLTRYVTKAHLARAVLEATAFQTRDVVEAMRADSGIAFTRLRVDGGMVSNDLLMQFQADVLDLPVVRPRTAETTALGAAYAAGLAVGVWPDTDSLRDLWIEGARWTPTLDPDRREHLYSTWKRAVTRTFDWE
jgi:glycerol kinase